MITMRTYRIWYVDHAKAEARWWEVPAQNRDHAMARFNTAYKGNQFRVTKVQEDVIAGELRKK